MTYNIKFQIEGLLVLLIVAVFYFGKVREKKCGESAFTFVLYAAIGNIILDIAATVTIFHRETIPLVNDIVNMLYLSSLNLLTFFICIYAQSLAGIRKQDKKNKKTKKNPMLLIPMLLSELCIVLFPIQYAQDSISPYSYGIPPYSVYACSLTYLILAIVIVISYKKVVPRISRISIYFFLGSELLAAFVQLFNKSYLVVGMAASMSVMFLFLAIENPDLNMIVRLDKEKKKITSDIAVAQRIQRDMLPCIFTAFPKRKEFDIDAVIHACSEAGGDTYDFFLIDSDHLALVISDVAGSGIPATLFMVISKMLIKNQLLNGDTPGEALSHVNKQFRMDKDGSIKESCWLGVLTISTGSLVYANAGHCSPLLKWTDSEAAYLNTHSDPALAEQEDTVYHEQTIQMEPGTVLFMYTDGLTAVKNINGEEYGELRLKQYVDKSLDRISSKVFSGFLQSVKQEVDEYSDSAELEDDIAMIALRIQG